MKKLILLSVVFLCGCSSVHVMTNSLIVADWGQTRHISDSQDFKEGNKLLGSNPTTGDVNKYFLSTLLVYNALYYTLPVKHRENFSLLVGVTRAVGVGYNFAAGVEIRF